MHIGCVEYNVAYTGIVETSETQSPNVVDWFKCQYVCKRLTDCVAFLYNVSTEIGNIFPYASLDHL